MKRGMGDVRVQAVPIGGWRLYCTFPTQEEAERAGLFLATAFKRELVVYGKDGKVRRKDSYGNDPRKTKG